MAQRTCPGRRLSTPPCVASAVMTMRLRSRSDRASSGHAPPAELIASVAEALAEALREPRGHLVAIDPELTRVGVEALLVPVVGRSHAQSPNGSGSSEWITKSLT